MKKTCFQVLIFVAALLAALWGGAARAESDLAVPYLPAEELPDMVKFMPAPPDWASPLFIGDHASYLWGKSLRGGERGARAVTNVVIVVDEMLAEFAKPFGMAVTREGTPAIHRVANRGVLTALRATKGPKKAYRRERPYVRYAEPTLIPAEEEMLRGNGSYPSGHSVRGWCLALLLTEINPAAQDGLLRLGYEWGECRVIAGYHWRSDVEAGRQLAAAVYARLHTCDAFLSDMAAARAEYARLSRAGGGQ